MSYTYGWKVTIVSCARRNGEFMHNTFRDVIFHTHSKAQPSTEVIEKKVPLKPNNQFTLGGDEYLITEHYYHLKFIGKAHKVFRWEYEKEHV